MYDEIILKTFLDNQTDLYPEPVAADMDEALDFLTDICAAVADTDRDVLDYLEEVGVDTEGMTREEIFAMPEVMEIGDGRYLILEI